MASQAQINANRANSRKSTGPRTAAGKTRVASNSFKHGLYAHLALFNPDTVAAITANYLAEFEPVTPSEHSLLQQLIHYQARFIQFQRYFDQLLDNGTALAFEELATNSKSLPLLVRELDRLPSRIRKTMADLRKLIAAREADPEPTPIADLPKIPIPESRIKANSPEHNAQNDPNWFWQVFVDKLFEFHGDELRELRHLAINPIPPDQPPTNPPASPDSAHPATS